MQSPEPNTSKPLTLGHWTVTFQCDVFPTNWFIHSCICCIQFHLLQKKIFVLFQNTKYYCTAVGINPKLLLLSWLIIFRYRKVLESCTARFCYTSFVSVGQSWIVGSSSHLTEGALVTHELCSEDAPGNVRELPGKPRLCCSLGLHPPGTAQLLVLPGHPRLWGQAASAARTAALPISVDLKQSLWFYQQCEISEYSLQKAELKQQLLVLDSGKNRIYSWDCSAPLTWPMDCSSGQQTSPKMHFKLSDPALNGLLNRIMAKVTQS